MKWSDCYSQAKMPSMLEISAFVTNPLWDELCTYLEIQYSVLPKINYSICSCAPGWNVKYRKNSRALCTLYPNEGSFICLVCVGSRETMEAELLLPQCTEEVQNLYSETKLFNSSRWLMIPVTKKEILDDVKKLIAIRLKK